jgi:hypothetical protein
VLQETILTDDLDQAAEMLGSGYHLAQQQDREPDGQGITTASRCCRRIFDHGTAIASDHYGLDVDLEPAAESP